MREREGDNPFIRASDSVYDESPSSDITGNSVNEADEVFDFADLRNGKDTSMIDNEVVPLHLTPLHHGIESPGGVMTVSEAFAKAIGRHPCLMCGGIDDGLYYESPPQVPELTAHFNQYQTALINTGCEALARLLNKSELKDKPVLAIMEIIRLFLQTDPVILSGYWRERPGRVERGQTVKADWIEKPISETDDVPVYGDISEDGEDANTPDATQAIAPQDGSEMLYDKPNESGLHNETKDAKE